MHKKKILITGSSRGIGASIARQAKKEGFEVLIHGKTDSKNLQSVKDNLDCRAITFDVANWEDAKTKLSKIGSLDALVNCAGLNYSAPLEDLKLEDWKSIYEIFSRMRCQCVRQGGAAQVYGRRPIPKQLPSVATI